MDAAKYKGVIPMINAEALRQAILVKPEKKYLLLGQQFQSIIVTRNRRLSDILRVQQFGFMGINLITVKPL